MDVLSCECCVLSGRGLCDGLITRPENSYRVWCVELSVIVERRKGALGPLRAVPPLKNNADWLYGGRSFLIFA